MKACERLGSSSFCNHAPACSSSTRPSPPAKLQARIGRTLETIIGLADGEGGATGRSHADAPEIDGEVHLRDAGELKPGDLVSALIEDADEHDLFGVPAAQI